MSLQSPPHDGPRKPQSEDSPEAIALESSHKNAGPSSLRDKVTRGSVWTVGGYAASQVLRLGGNLVLWRLLHPEAFGLMAVVNVFIQGLHMFSDVGIGPAIVQNERGDEPDYLNTAWTIQIVRGLALFSISVVLALPVASFYGEPQLAWLVPVAAANALLSGFNSTRLFTAKRHIALHRLVILELVSQFAALVCMVTLAYIYRTVWSLVAGGIVSAALTLALSHFKLPGIRNRLRWDPSSARTLLHFGRWIFLSTVLSFAVMQSDRLIFGKMVPMERLGVYSIATVWATLPTVVINHVFNSVVFPALSRLYHQGVAFHAAFRETRTPWLILAGYLTACLLAGGPTLVRALYDERALEAGWIIQALALGSWFLTLETTNSTALLAQGRSKWMAAGSAGKLLGMILLISLGYRLYGFPGAVLGFASSELMRYAVSVLGAIRIGLRGTLQDLGYTAMLLATAGAGLVTARAAEHALSDFGLPRRLGAFTEGTAVFLVVSLAWGLLYAFHRASTRRAKSVF